MLGSARESARGSCQARVPVPGGLSGVGSGGLGQARGVQGRVQGRVCGAEEASAVIGAGHGAPFDRIVVPFWEPLSLKVSFIFGHRLWIDLWKLLHPF